MPQTPCFAERQPRCAALARWSVCSGQRCRENNLFLYHYRVNCGRLRRDCFGRPGCYELADVSAFASRGWIFAAGTVDLQRLTVDQNIRAVLEMIEPTVKLTILEDLLAEFDLAPATHIVITLSGGNVSVCMTWRLSRISFYSLGPLAGMD